MTGIPVNFAARGIGTIDHSMILVTSAAGKTGRAVVGALARRGVPVRALVRAARHQASLLALGAEEVVVADLLDAADMARALEGIRRVYLITPNVHPAEVEIGQTAIDAGRSVGVERLVYHSVLHPQARSMPHHKNKLLVEERLFESGLDYTILQPSAYMQNLLPYWNAVVSTSRYRVPYGECGALSLVDLEDVAEVAATVLAQSDDHGNATYELAGPHALTPGQVADALSKHLGYSIAALQQPLEEWSAFARDSGLGEFEINALERMFEYYDRYGLRGNPRILATLLDRSPVDLPTFLSRVLGGDSETNGD